jgi:hypothetical protein
MQTNKYGEHCLSMQLYRFKREYAEGEKPLAFLYKLGSSSSKIGSS